MLRKYIVRAKRVATVLRWWHHHRVSPVPVLEACAKVAGAALRGWLLISAAIYNWPAALAVPAVNLVHSLYAGALVARAAYDDPTGNTVTIYVTIDHKDSTP